MSPPAVRSCPLTRTTAIWTRQQCCWRRLCHGDFIGIYWDGNRIPKTDKYTHIIINVCIYIYDYICIYICIYMVVVLNSFARTWLLGRPWANLARRQSRVSFWLRMFSCPVFVLVFVKLHIPIVCIPICVCVSVRLLIIRTYIFLVLPIYTLYIHVHACVFDRAA
jgi:hypothetical protein